MYIYIYRESQYPVNVLQSLLYRESVLLEQGFLIKQFLLLIVFLQRMYETQTSTRKINTNKLTIIFSCKFSVK